MMRQMHGIFALLCVAAHSAPAGAQDAGEPPVGRWVKEGTYALSGFAVNAKREDSYRGAANERARLLSYLPPMTIVFPDYIGLIKADTIPAGYVAGITQTGIPIMVLDGELSQQKFGAYETHDVVIHATHMACSKPHCDLSLDGRTVGQGSSYKIADDSGGLVHLYHPESETNLYYSEAYFDELELRGSLTRMKDRTVPRWEIREGYAKDLSLSCGGEHPQGMTFTVGAEDYETSPAFWVLNAPQWTMKAAALFVGSHVEKADGAYTAELTKRIHDLTKPDNAGDEYQSAIDFSVFAYRDRNYPGSGYNFAVLISIVACKERTLFGPFQPDYVREAHLYFDNESYKLTQQLSEYGKEQMSGQFDRSFMYSINTPQQYSDLTNDLSSKLTGPYAAERANLIAVVVGRLNATCSEVNRPTCAAIVKANPAQSETPHGSAGGI